MLLMATPSTAQLVVIRGRYTPRPLCREGENFLSSSSVICTRAAMTRMNTMFCIKPMFRGFSTKYWMGQVTAQASSITAVTAIPIPVA